MAKNQGFAALAALQNKPAELETPTENSSNTDTVDPSGEDLGDVSTTERGQTTVFTTFDEMAFIPVEPAQPNFDAIPDTPTFFPDGGIRLLNDLPVTEWTNSELESYIAGTVSEETYLATLKAAIKEYLIRDTKLSPAWSIEECRNYLKTGVEPSKTSKGAWVNDITRQYRREHEWVTNELESWALGEIKAEGATTDGGLAIELKQRLNLQLPGVDVQAVITNYRHNTGQATKAVEETRPTPVTPTVTATQIEQVTKSIKLEGVTELNQSYIDSSLAKFEAAMVPGKAINETVAGESQRLLRDVLLYAIGLADPVGAKNAMQYLIDYFRPRRAVGKIFEDTYAFRGINDMRTTKKEQVAHHDLLTLFLAYADPMVELRAQTDIPSLIGGVKASLQSRVLEFFSRVQ